jgi:hypothetical protein
MSDFGNSTCRELTMEPLTVIEFGCLGGLLPDLLRIAKNRFSSDVPMYLSRWWYWVGLAMQICVGGFVAWLLAASDVPQALAYGYAAPSILTTLIADRSQMKEVGPAKGRGRGLRAWWAH